MLNRPPSTYAGAQPQQNQTNHINQNPHDREFPIEYTIFGGGRPGYALSKRNAYNIGMYEDPEVMQINLVEATKSYPNNNPIPITFTKDEVKQISQPQSDALVVELEISKHRVMRNLFDGGSSSDILFTRAFSQLNFLDKTLKRMKNPLRGFAGNEVVPLGRITLKVTFDTAPCQASIDVNFMVVDSPSVYNTIIGKETLHAFRAIASTYHMLLKFPTMNGIRVVDKAQTLSRETYQIATFIRSQQHPLYPSKYDVIPKCIEVGAVDYGYLTGAIQLGNLDPRYEFYEQRGSLVKELEEIQFGLDEPGKTFKIGKLLCEPLRTKLIEFLRAHKTNFA